MTNRYMTPLKYKDGNGNQRNTKVYFELDPVELADWTFEHPFEANELRASLIELREIEKEESRDLTQEEIRTMLGVIKLLAQIAAGRPTDDGEYFLKDPNWTSSYAYRGFRQFLLMNPKEVQTFLTTLLNNKVMEEFTKALDESNQKIEAEAAQTSTNDSGPDTLEKMRQRVKEMEAQQASNVTTLPTPSE
jgi:hypothetical protein